LTFAFLFAVPDVRAKAAVEDLNFTVVEGFYDAFGIELFFGGNEF
jgi:hypothetical protein